MSTMILEEIGRLSVAERIQLVEDIWDSIAAAPETVELTPSQREELDRRLHAYTQDSEAGATWDEVKSKLKN